MSVSYNDFKTIVLYIFNRIDKDNELLQATKDTYKELAQDESLFDKLKTSSVLTGISSINDYQLNLPDDFSQIISLKYTDTASPLDYCELDKISKSEYNYLLPDPTSTSGNTGIPEKYTIYGSKIWIYPLVDKSTYQFTLDYTYNPTITEDDTSLPFESNIELVKLGVLYRLYQSVENYQTANYWKNEYYTLLQKTRDQQNKNSSAPTIVQAFRC